MLEGLVDLFGNYTIQIVFIGSLILGITAGCLGTFAVLRQQSLLGDAIAHATLPGVCLAFLITQTKNPFILLIGAGISGWIASLFLKLIIENTQLKKDAALGIILSVFFGFGLLLITIIQKLPTATKSGLDKFIFGNAATLLKEDVIMMGIFSLFIFIVLILFWKEFKILVFDRDYAASLGMPIHFFDIFLTTLIVIAIVIGLQTVGVVLMSAMVVAPAAAARQWTDRLGIMVFLSALFGAISGTFGAITSSVISNLPTGPTIVIFLSIFVFVSLMFAPNRGLLWDWIRTRRNRKKILTTTMLRNLLLFSEIQTNPFHPHDISALNAIGRGAIDGTMGELQNKGWAEQFKDKRWALTPRGLDKARQLAKEYEEGIYDSPSD